MSLPIVRAGSEVSWRMFAYDNRVDPPVLFDPSDGVKITLMDPDGVTRASEDPMTHETTGVYTYQYQTDTGDPTGPWMVSFMIQDGSSIVLTVNQVAFMLTVSRI